ncbi:MAG: glycosidase [Syntrophales bacterium]|nr:glycosidase [Syntrophales bacterium]
MLFKRHEQNPIIKPSDIPYPVNSVFNAGATFFKEKVLLLMRVEDKRGLSHFGLAISDNGVDGWEVKETPVLLPDPVKYPEEEWGIEDPRITFIPELELWVIAYTAYSRRGPLVSLATTSDFREFSRIRCVLPPENKNAALFPERFQGRFAMLHRPVPAMTGASASIWISFSPDLKHWGDHQLVIPAREGGWWDAGRIGCATPPLKTHEGWLILYHGVKNTASGPIYRLGLALLDLSNPTRVVKRSEEWIFGPEESYEISGDVDKVVFPCGWVVQGGDIKLYYGGGDKCLALAQASLPDVLSYLTESRKC